MPVAGLHLGWWNEIHISISNTNDTSTVLAKPTNETTSVCFRNGDPLTSVDPTWPWKGDMSPNCPGPDDPDFPSLGSLKKNWMENFPLSTFRTKIIINIIAIVFFLNFVSKFFEKKSFFFLTSLNHWKIPFGTFASVGTNCSTTFNVAPMDFFTSSKCFRWPQKLGWRGLAWHVRASRWTKKGNGIRKQQRMHISS